MVTVRGDDFANTIYQNGYGAELDIYTYGGNDRIYLNVGGSNGGWNWVAAGADDDRVYNVYEGGNEIDLGTGNDFYSTIGFSTNPDYYDVVRGYDGSDVFEVSTFHSDYYGEIGNDTFYSVGFNNYFNGGSGTDVISYELQDDDPDLAGSGVVVDLRDGYAYTKGTEYEETLVSIENAVGSGAADHLYGSIGNNSLWGAGGRDFIDGDAGDDRLSGEAGGDAIYGAAGNDKLYGGNDNDSIYGNDDNDYIVGGAGNDRLSGGLGSETFLFDSAFSRRTNIDVITDFTNNGSQNDVFWLDDAIFAGLTMGEIGTAAFKDRSLGRVDGSDRIIYYQESGELYFDRDGSGTAYGATKIAVLENHAQLTATDFLVV